ncbi:hypothetical protein ACTFIY_007229 [Dictyostelium cf. discoideum]
MYFVILYYQKKIFAYCRLYKKNIFKTFEGIKSLIEYQEREYIGSLYFKGDSGDLLKVGDLPIGGVLKNIIISLSNLESGKSIPYGVETISLVCNYFGKSKHCESFQLSSLPSTVRTIKGISLGKPKNELNNVYVIPPNIKSISLYNCKQWSISKEAKNNFIQIPNTIKILKLGEQYGNQNLPLKKGDLPSDLKKLMIDNHEIEYSNDFLPQNGLIKLTLNCDLNTFKELILPTTLKFLQVTLNSMHGKKDGKNNICNEIFNKLPSNLEDVHIYFKMDVSKISKNSNLSKCKSIKKLTIEYEFMNYGQTYEPKSFPSSVTDLTILNVANQPLINFPFPKNIKKLSLTTSRVAIYGKGNVLVKKTLIPNSITSLALNFINDEEGCFPSSLTHFEFLKNDFDLFKGGPNKEELLRMLSKLPKSLIHLVLPDYVKRLNLNVNPNIILNYKYYE